MDRFIFGLKNLYATEKELYNNILHHLPELAGFLPGPAHVSLLFRQLSLIKAAYMLEEDQSYKWEQQNLVSWVLLLHAIKSNQLNDQSHSADIILESSQHTLNLSNALDQERFNLKFSHVIGAEDIAHLDKYEKNLRRCKDKSMQDSLAEFADKKKVFLLVIFIYKLSQDNEALASSNLEPALMFRKELETCRRARKARTTG
jgi:hypothetical protein